MRKPGLEGACWPEPLQEHVLRAALTPGARGVEAWRAIRGDLDLDDIWDPEIHRLLPLVYVNLAAAGVADPDLPRLKGLYRRTWYMNQLRLAEARPWLELLAGEGIGTLLLKGVPLGLHYYGDLGQRPMNDVDVLVPFAQASHALDLLEADGWRDVGSLPRDRTFRWHHGAGLVHHDGGELDLHWYLGEEFVLADRPEASSDTFWKNAQLLDVQGFATKMLDPTDMLVHTCVHGAWSGSAATVRWVADASFLLRRAADDIDWTRVVDHARSFRVVLSLQNALTYLRETFDVPIPSEALDELARVPTTRREQRLYRVAAGPVAGPEVLGGLLHTRAYWAHTRQKWTTARSVREFPAFVEDLWGLDHAWQIPADVTRKAMRRLRKEPRRVRGNQPAGVSGVSVVVPTYRRAEQLAVCLDALLEQSTPPKEIIVVHRVEDTETIRALDAYRERLVVVSVDGPGSIAALRAGTAVASGSIIAFTDDDAVPHRRWCERIQRRFAEPEAGVVGGRDLLTIEGKPVVGRSTTVGVIRPWGRVVGHHHTGWGRTRPVDHVKGVNMAVRRELLQFPVGLRGEGSPVYHELATCLAVKQAGALVLYDPFLLVDHVWGVRFGEDTRTEPTLRARTDAVFNQSYILFSMLPRRRWTRLAYVVFWGDRGNGGVVRCAWARVSGDRELASLFMPYLRAHRDAWRAAAAEPLALVPGVAPSGDA
jgi:glycosyltransferase involved in cell wall biosynthesis